MNGNEIIIYRSSNELEYDNAVLLWENIRQSRNIDLDVASTDTVLGMLIVNELDHIVNLENVPFPILVNYEYEPSECEVNIINMSFKPSWIKEMDFKQWKIPDAFI